MPSIICNGEISNTGNSTGENTPFVEIYCKQRHAEIVLDLLPNEVDVFTKGRKVKITIEVCDEVDDN